MYLYFQNVLIDHYVNITVKKKDIKQMSTTKNCYDTYTMKGLLETENILSLSVICVKCY